MANDLEWRVRFSFKDRGRDETPYSDAVKVGRTWVDDDGDAWPPRYQDLLNALEAQLRQESGVGA